MTALSSENLAVLQAENALQAGRGLPRLPGGKLDIQKARQTAEDFEAVFLAEMFKPMFENLEAEEPFGGGSGADIWRDMQTQEYGKAVAKAGGIGIADAVLRQIIKMQEG